MYLPRRTRGFAFIVMYIFVDDVRGEIEGKGDSFFDGR